MLHSRRHGGMDMDGTDMGMGGMDMANSGLFPENKRLARDLWYVVAAVVVTIGLCSLVNYLRTKIAKRKYSLRSDVPARPTNAITQAYDTVVTCFRETSYPAARPFHGRVLRSFTPPPLGRSIVILTYWMIILILVFSNVLLKPSSPLYGYKWEKPAFRAGWISVTQVPLLYALSCKINVISILTGISYERLNWLHRWVSRTLFLTIIVHWAYFFHEWTLADFVQYQFEMMPMVKYGFGAWAVIGWIVLTGFGFFRDLCYELWVLQHLASAGFFLWLLYVHVPSYAQYNVWLAVAFVVFDRGLRGIWSIVNNLHLRVLGKGGIGFRAEATALSGGYLRLAVKDIEFNWRPGQHVFLSIPACGIFESHPFTIANTRLGPNYSSLGGQERGSRELEVFFKCHSGFTKRLQNRAQKATSGTTSTHRVFLSGPWGTAPLSSIERSNTLIFVASSTGASYTMPLLEHAVKNAPFVQRVCFYWIVRHTCQISWFDQRLRAAMRQLASLGLEDVTFKIFVTGQDEGSDLNGLHLPSDSITEVKCCWLKAHGLPSEIVSTNNSTSTEKGNSSMTGSTTSADDNNQEVFEKPLLSVARKVSSSNSSDSSSGGCCGCKTCKCKPTMSSPSFTVTLGRPQSFDPLIRPTVEAAQGETVIVACGGKDMMAQIGTYVAALSDDRAVHKGTGAQSIELWTESYGW